MSAIELNLPIAPSTNDIWDIVQNRRTGKRRMARSNVYDAWIKEAGWEVNITKPKPRRVEGRYHLTIIVARDNSRDLDNCLKATNDLLQKMLLIKNDKLTESVTMRWSDRDQADWLGFGRMKVIVDEVE